MNGKPQAMYGYNDDLSMAAAIGLYVMTTHLSDLVATRDSIIASLNSIQNDYSEAGESLLVTNKNFSRERRNDNPWTMITNKGTVENLDWLIGKK